jgi:hypothetical protein
MADLKAARRCQPRWCSQSKRSGSPTPSTVRSSSNNSCNCFIKFGDPSSRSESIYSIVIERPTGIGRWRFAPAVLNHLHSIMDNGCAKPDDGRHVNKKSWGRYQNAAEVHRHCIDSFEPTSTANRLRTHLCCSATTYPGKITQICIGTLHDPSGHLPICNDTKPLIYKTFLFSKHLIRSIVPTKAHQVSKSQTVH